MSKQYTAAEQYAIHEYAISNGVSSEEAAGEFEAFCERHKDDFNEESSTCYLFNVVVSHPLGFHRLLQVTMPTDDFDEARVAAIVEAGYEKDDTRVKAFISSLMEMP